MSEPGMHFEKPPIVEAIVDIDCDFVPGFALSSLEEAGRTAFCDVYPKMQKHFLHEFSVALKPGEAASQSSRRGLQAFQFLRDDGNQLVQIRASGFSFNRLAPYGGFDEYLPEIQRTWELYRSVASPIKVQAVQLRYINRIRLPSENEKVDLGKYFKNGPRLPDGSGLTLIGFLNQYQAIEEATGYSVATVLTAETPKDDCLPIIFDNAARAQIDIEPTDWDALSGTLQGLRTLKNRVFKNTLEDKCLEQFQ